jgi:hypothetical protein
MHLITGFIWGECRVQIICYEREALAVSATGLLDPRAGSVGGTSLIEDLHVGRETRDSQIGSAMSWKNEGFV